MERAAFEAELSRDGYEVVDKTIPPDQDRRLHAHDFDARILVLEGELTVSIGEARTAHRAGEVFEVPAGTPHAEHTGAAGARFLLGKRRPTP
jgi:quercetin dioxygenase-like cupin family protein